MSSSKNRHKRKLQAKKRERERNLFHANRDVNLVASVCVQVGLHLNRKDDHNWIFMNFEGKRVLNYDPCTGHWYCITDRTHGKGATIMDALKLASDPHLRAKKHQGSPIATPERTLFDVSTSQ